MLTGAATSAISELLPGPFAYAEGRDEATDAYWGLVIDGAASVLVVIDNESLIAAPKVAEANRPDPPKERPVEPTASTPDTSLGGDGAKPDPFGPVDEKPTPFSFVSWTASDGSTI